MRSDDVRAGGGHMMARAVRAWPLPSGGAEEFTVTWDAGGILVSCHVNGVPSGAIRMTTEQAGIVLGLISWVLHEANR